MIKTVNDNQFQILKDILCLYCKEGVELDPTFSKGNFYKKSGIPTPKIISDLYPQIDGCIKADACSLSFIENDSIKSIMFDPPFLVVYKNNEPSGIIGKRFFGFKTIKELWSWYDKCLLEFRRILLYDGVVIFKCQDTISGGKQHLSHVHIINEAMKLGYEVLDLFVLTAKSRIIGHNHGVQKHARKFHSYFLVLRKGK